MSKIEIVTPFEFGGAKQDIFSLLISDWAITDGSDATATLIKLTMSGSGDTITLKGTGFEVDDAGHMTGGTVSAVILETSYGAEFRITGIGIALTELATTLDGQVRQEVADLFATMDFTGSSGDDAVFGSSGADVFFGGRGSDLFTGNGGADHFDGGRGLDAVSYFYGGALTVNLLQPGLSTGDAAGDTYAGIEGIVSSSEADTLFGDESRNFFLGMGGDDVISGRGGRDFLAGMGGNDVIEGGLGADFMAGSGGDDVFVYTKAGDSLVERTGRDFLSVFHARNEDIIDVSQIDAIAGGADDDFTFIGTGSFTGLGQIRISLLHSNTLVEFNLSGDTAADMAIVVDGNHLRSLGAGDFIL